MKKNAPKNPYVKKGFISRLPLWFKALFIKFWFAGAVFYFIGWGLFIQSIDQLDLTLSLGLVLGLTADLLVNRILVFMESGKKECRRYIFCYTKNFVSLPVNLLFGVINALLIAYAYHFINTAAINMLGRPEGYIALGAEPILYGLFYLAFDMIFIFFKNTLIKVFNKAKEAL